MKLPINFLNVIVIISIIFGVIQCFFGYRIFKIILGLFGFFLGSVSIGFIAYSMSGKIGISILSGIIGGTIGAVLMIALFFVGVFLAGAFLGVLTGAVFLSISTSSLSHFILIIFAVIGGILALLLQKSMIILATSFIGSWNVVTGIAYFMLEGYNPINPTYLFMTGGTQHNIILFCWIILGIIGLLVQSQYIPLKLMSKSDKE